MEEEKLIHPTEQKVSVGVNQNLYRTQQGKNYLKYLGFFLLSGHTE